MGKEPGEGAEGGQSEKMLIDKASLTSGSYMILRH